MTLESLKKACQKAEISYVYGVFNKPTEPPHLTGRLLETDNFSADNKVFHKNINFMLELTMTKKEPQIQKIIENEILKDVFWNKGEENYISKEKIWNVPYFFNIEEENKI